MLRLTLVGRSYCSLCDTMKAACLDAIDRHHVAVDLRSVDLDDHPALEGNYGEWVPVLLLGSLETGSEICHYHFNESLWLAACQLDAVKVVGKCNSSS